MRVTSLIVLLAFACTVYCATNVYGSYKASTDCLYSCKSTSINSKSFSCFNTTKNHTIFGSTLSKQLYLNFTSSTSNNVTTLKLPESFWVNGTAAINLDYNYVISFFRCDTTYTYSDQLCYKTTDRYNTYVVNKW